MTDDNALERRLDALLSELRRGRPDFHDVQPVIYERPDMEAYRAMFPRAGRGA